MSGKRLVYIADPMCSWCWGFSPVMDAVRERFSPAVPVDLLMGGLRPGTTEAMDEAAKKTVKEHWGHVQAATGQPFDFAFFEREGFVYDTEPPSRAVIAVRGVDKDGSFTMLKLIHQAFYARNEDVTDRVVLAGLAEKAGVEEEVFSSLFDSKDIQAETLQEFDAVRSAGISGFPALIAGNETRGFEVVTVGYRPWEDLEGAIGAALEGG